RAVPRPCRGRPSPCCRCGGILLRMLTSMMSSAPRPRWPRWRLIAPLALAATLGLATGAAAQTSAPRFRLAIAGLTHGHSFILFRTLTSGNRLARRPALRRSRSDAGRRDARRRVGLRGQPPARRDDTHLRGPEAVGDVREADGHEPCRR